MGGKVKKRQRLKSLKKRSQVLEEKPLKIDRDRVKHRASSESFTIRKAEGDDKVTISGYVSLKGVTDSYGFKFPKKDNLYNLNYYKKYSILYKDHYVSSETAIGRAVDLYEDERGLFARYELTRGIEEKLLMKIEDKVVTGFSTGSYDRMEDDGKTIKEMEIIEVSLVPAPAVAGAGVSGRSSLEEKQGGLLVATELERNEQIEKKLEERSVKVDKSINDLQESIKSKDDTIERLHKKAEDLEKRILVLDESAEERALKTVKDYVSKNVPTVNPKFSRDKSRNIEIRSYNDKEVISSNEPHRQEALNLGFQLIEAEARGRRDVVRSIQLEVLQEKESRVRQEYQYQIDSTENEVIKNYIKGKRDLELAELTQRTNNVGIGTNETGLLFPDEVDDMIVVLAQQAPYLSSKTTMHSAFLNARAMSIPQNLDLVISEVNDGTDFTESTIKTKQHSIDARNYAGRVEASLRLMYLDQRNSNRFVNALMRQIVDGFATATDRMILGHDFSTSTSSESGLYRNSNVLEFEPASATDTYSNLTEADLLGLMAAVDDRADFRKCCFLISSAGLPGLLSKRSDDNRIVQGRPSMMSPGDEPMIRGYFNGSPVAYLHKRIMSETANYTSTALRYEGTGTNDNTTNIFYGDFSKIQLGLGAINFRQFDQTLGRSMGTLFAFQRYQAHTLPYDISDTSDGQSGAVIARAQLTVS